MSDEHYTPRSLNLDTVYGSSEAGEAPVGFAVIGAGSMGAEHVETVRAVGRGEIVGIYDPNDTSVRYTLAQLDNPDAVTRYPDLDSACGDPAVEAVIIATPNNTHRRVAEAAVAAGKHVLIEKPMAHTTADAAALVRLAAESDGVFSVGFEYRYKPIYAEIMRELPSVGTVRQTYIQEHRPPFLEKWRQWNKFADQSGGTLVEKCCHYFDLFSLVAGSRPKKVFASGAQDVNFRSFEYEGQRSDILDNAFVIVDYENGVRACLNLCMFAWRPDIHEQMSICGDDGALYAYDEPRSEIFVGPNDRSAAARRIHVSLPPRVRSTGTHSGSTYFEHLAFAEAVRTGGPAPIPAEDGMWAVAIGEAAEISARRGEPVFLEELVPMQNA